MKIRKRTVWRTHPEARPRHFVVADGGYGAEGSHKIESNEILRPQGAQNDEQKHPLLKCRRGQGEVCLYDEDLGNKNKALLNDNSHTSRPPALQTSELAPIPTFPHKGRRCAFTLAEVLITLGIIGVVAALTLPTLIQNYKKTETSTKLKKFYSVMEQAIKMSELDNGDAKNWVKGDMIPADADGNFDYEANGAVTTDFFMRYLAPYFKYDKIESGKNTIKEDGTPSGTNTKVYLSDGTYVTFFNGTCLDIIFSTDKRNDFRFLLCPEPGDSSLDCGIKKIFCAYKHRSDKTRAQALERCKTSDQAYCTGLLMMDNWEFNDDYPYKL